jgi:hypothetical protein
MANTKGASFPQFFYRRNSDETIDAICAFCFENAATAANEANLHEREAAHICVEETALPRKKKGRLIRWPIVS